MPAQHFVVAPELLCGYRNKVCTAPRATKIDGSLHKLCEFHRRKANLSQQRLHHRRRQERAKSEDAAATGTKRRRRRVDANALKVFEPRPLSEPSGVELLPEDMAVLELLLFDAQPLPGFGAPLVKGFPEDELRATATEMVVAL